MENKKRTDMEECVIKYKDNFYLKTEVGYKKIILTTDQDLIKDDLQVIDDEFLEWFVKNPSCESAEMDLLKRGIYDKYKYNIILPKEEPKQETLEEAGLKHCDILDKFPALENPIFSFKEGAKWQAERSYSKEEVLEHINNVLMMPSSKLDTFTDEEDMITMKWFEQFKKK